MSKVQPAPITPVDLLNTVIRPVLIEMQNYDSIPHTREAERMLVAICGQETDFNWRRQVLSDGSPGPASGRWQFEKGGGVKGVMTHVASRDIAARWLMERRVPGNTASAWEALEHDDALACAFARLLLWTDPYAIPTTQEAAWVCYAERLWRPGKAHPETWPGYWATAGEAVLAPPPTEPPPDDNTRDEMLRLLDEIDERTARLRGMVP